MSNVSTIVASDDKLSAGSWVPEQGLATEQGFRNVSAPWYAKTIPIADGIGALQEIKANQREFLFNRKDVSFSFGDGGFTVSLGEHGDYQLSEHGGQKIAGWFNVPIAVVTEYGVKDRGIPADVCGDILTRCFNAGRDSYADKTSKELLWKVDDEKRTIRFVASSEYDTVTNEWYLESLAKIIPGGRLSHYKMSDGDTLYGNVLIPDTIRAESDSDYGAMLSLSNCEVGKRCFGVDPSLFRFICQNGCVWGATEGVAYKKRHRGIDCLDGLYLALKSHVEKQIPLAVQAMDLFPELHKLTFAKERIESIFAAVVSESGVSSGLANTAYDEWEQHSNECSAFGLVDGFTRAGQRYAAQEWHAADVWAGNLLIGGSKAWDRLNAKAKSMTTDKIRKALDIVG